MTTLEKIQDYVTRLPSTFQAEVLDFVEYLLVKATQQMDEDREWTNLSLQMMMKDLENEAGPEYTNADLKVIFR